MILLLLLVDSFLLPPTPPRIFLSSSPLGPGPWEADPSGHQLWSDHLERQQESARRGERSQHLCSPTSILPGCHGTHVWRSQLLPDGSPCLSPGAGNGLFLLSLHRPKLLQKIPSLNSLQMNQFHMSLFPLTPKIIRKVILSQGLLLTFTFVSYLLAQSDKIHQTQPAPTVSLLHVCPCIQLMSWASSLC